MTEDNPERIANNVIRALTKSAGTRVLDHVVFRLPEPAEVGASTGTMRSNPVILGTNILAETILAEIHYGATPRDIVANHPTLTTDAVAAVVEWHHANGGSDLRRTPTGIAIEEWLWLSAVNLKVADAMLGLSSFFSLTEFVMGSDPLLPSRKIDGELRIPRRAVLLLKKRIDAVPPVVADPGFMGIPMIEHVIASERRHWRDLVTNDNGTPAIFETLARRSSLVASDSFMPRWEAQSAFTPPNAEKLPFELIIGWDRYGRRWETFKEQNPRVMIASLMSDISESHDSSSFPFGWEHLVKEWVAGGMPDPYPFHNRNGLDLVILRREMADALAKAGPGWVADVGTNGVELKWVIS